MPMRVMLDQSPAKIAEYTEKFQYEFWQFRTPLTRYKIAPVPWGLDNGCFTHFHRKEWEAMLIEAKKNMPVFVTLPDVWGDARRTMELFHAFFWKTEHLPRALVLQDGVAELEIPWKNLSGVFLGGSDAFRILPSTTNILKAAKILGKWIHIGRLNSPDQIKNWCEIANSLDGSGLSRFDDTLDKMMKALKNENRQPDLDL